MSEESTDLHLHASRIDPTVPVREPHSVCCVASRYQTILVDMIDLHVQMHFISIYRYLLKQTRQCVVKQGIL